MKTQPGQALPAGTDDSGPGWRALGCIGVALLALAMLMGADAQRLPVHTTVGVGPAAGLRLVALLVALLGACHLVAAWRRRRAAAASSDPTGQDATASSRASLAWILGGLAGLALAIEVGAGFVLGATWLFIATARAFGQRLGARSIAIGLVLTLAVYLFFTQALSLSLPAGPLEKLVGA